MKIAVSSTGKELSSQVDPRFGRAAYLLIIDSDSGAITEVIDNSAAGAMAQGAGISAASRIAEAGAKAILTGVVGPKAAVVCEKAGIAMINEASGTVAEAVNKFIGGALSQTETPPRTASSPSPAGQGRGGGRCRAAGGTGRGQGQGSGRRRGQCGPR
ncbi:MAG: NifB/NifX family molybdenum-iron cluster-binding protein [Thermodesulfobacteriota bacterium]